MRRLPLLPALAAAVLVAACAPPTSADRFGEAVRTNMALHIIEPAPVDLSQPPADGVRRALAIERYRADQVEKPEDVSAARQ
jgi:type IV pilus biogenesis protein CpaD/CtpE